MDRATAKDVLAEFIAAKHLQRISWSS